MEYAKFKLEGCLELINTAKVFVDNQNKKVSIGYTIERPGIKKRRADGLLQDLSRPFYCLFVIRTRHPIEIEEIEDELVHVRRLEEVDVRVD